MKKALIIAMIALASFSGCGDKVTDSDPSFDYKVGICLSQTRAESKPELTLTNRVLTFKNILNTYCNAPDYLTVSYVLEGNIIKIIETLPENAVPVRCTCAIPVEGTIKDLTSTGYQVEFWFEDKLNEQNEMLYRGFIEELF